MHLPSPPLVLLLLATASLTGCGQPAQLYVDDAYVRLPAVAGRPGVAYFTLHGAEGATRLLSVTSPVVIKSELHESMQHSGTMSMAPIKEVTVPAKATITFAPGGKHVMLFNINKRIAPGKTMPLVFNFANNERIEVDAPVIAAGDPAPNN